MLTSSGVYKITRVGTNDCYVGQAINISKRWVTHRQDFKNGRHASRFMQRVFDKHGLEAFRFEVLEEVNADKLDVTETKWIKRLKPVYNSAPVVGSCLGYKHSEETKDKHRRLMLGNKINKGRKSSFKGKHHTEESKLKISMAKKGVPNLARVGQKHSAATKLKISRSKKGVPNLKLKGRPKNPEDLQKAWATRRRLAAISRTHEMRV